MHDGMPYDPIQGQVKVMGLLNFRKWHFLGLSPPPFTMGVGKRPLILKLQHNI